MGAHHHADIRGSYRSADGVATIVSDLLGLLDERV
jgi:hypothetical protein